jgi:hypothetical protein
VGQLQVNVFPPLYREEVTSTRTDLIAALSVQNYANREAVIRTGPTMSRSALIDKSAAHLNKLVNQ